MRSLKAGLAAGLVGGALDIIAALTIYPAVYAGLTPMQVLQSVASGVQGAAAGSGGWASAMLGLGLHFLIALAFGLVLAAAMARLAISQRLWPLTGAIFGVCVYFFMQKVVLPLSMVPMGNGPDAKAMAIGLAIHIFIFGIPTAFVARQFLSRGAPLPPA